MLVAVAPSGMALNEFMSPLQLFVFALVVAIYVPCIATIAVLRREVGWKWTAIITVSTFLLALIVGGLVYHLNPLGLSASAAKI